MEKRIFRTLVKNEHKLGKNEYVLGKISGIAYCLCSDRYDLKFAIVKCKKGNILTVCCTLPEYARFAVELELLYPGLCIYDYKNK